MNTVPPAPENQEDLKRTRRGCLLALVGGWIVWIVVDLARLGVLKGERSIGEALFGMWSFVLPLVLVVGLSPLMAQNWLESRRKKTFPGEPWMWERRWSRVGARSLEMAKLWPPLPFGLLVTGLVVALAIVARYAIKSDLLLVALTPAYAFALGFWIWWGVRLARVLRFGRPFFRYETFPFFLGGQLEGTLEGVEGIAGFSRLTLTLRCVRERWAGRSRYRTRETVCELLLEVEPSAVVDRPDPGPGAGGLLGAMRPVVPVRFQLPKEDLGTKLFGSPTHRWELHARAELRGFDFDAVFLLPVYAVPGSSDVKP
jgi:hypothetical protein